jgi:ubiquitin-conjugating enzyme E2 J1
LKQLRENPPEKFRANPVKVLKYLIKKDNFFEWHFTMQGPEGSDFEFGIYHGKIELPSEYPIKPPNIYFLTPNGRFQLKTKICLNITKYHPENWNPSWTSILLLLS